MILFVDDTTTRARDLRGQSAFRLSEAETSPALEPHTSGGGIAARNGGCYHVKAISVSVFRTCRRSRRCSGSQSPPASLPSTIPTQARRGRVSPSCSSVPGLRTSPAFQ